MSRLPISRTIALALLAGAVGVPTVFYAANVIVQPVSPQGVQLSVNSVVPSTGFSAIKKVGELSTLKSILTTNAATFTLLKDRASFDVAGEVAKCGDRQNTVGIAGCFEALRTKCNKANLFPTMRIKNLSSVTKKQKDDAKKGCNEYVELGAFSKNAVTCDAMAALKDKRKCIRTLWTGATKDRVVGKEEQACMAFTNKIDRDRCLFSAVLASKNRNLCAKITSPDFREACETE